MKELISNGVTSIRVLEAINAVLVNIGQVTSLDHTVKYAITQVVLVMGSIWLLTIVAVLGKRWSYNIWLSLRNNL